MQKARGSLLIEATCNQVNQFDGYTGMTPADFVRYMRGIAEENNFPFENIILGGDHLGPSVWQDEPAESAMEKADQLIRDYVKAGFVKIHLDCSMPLADDPKGALSVEVSAERTARLAKVAGDSLSPWEGSGGEGLRYVIGTEVPIPGGAKDHGEGISVTKVEDVRQTLEVTREAFYRAGLGSAWDRVIAVVVQPGVEFGDDFVFPYQPDAAQGLSAFIQSQPMVYEAYSTDYQTRQVLRNLVRDHFAILKVGPALTFAFREAVFVLARMENELVPSEEVSNILSVLDEVMVSNPEHWVKYYHGSTAEKAFKRRYSLSDRIRYYWTHPAVEQALESVLKIATETLRVFIRRIFCLDLGAFLTRIVAFSGAEPLGSEFQNTLLEKMMVNLDLNPLPAILVKHQAPDVYTMVGEASAVTAEQILLAKIQNVLDDYAAACNSVLW